MSSPHAIALAAAGAAILPAFFIRRTSFEAMNPQEIESLIRAHLPDTTVTVQSADNVHFDAVVVSPVFAGKRTLQRHRLIYGALGDHIGGAIHALSIKRSPRRMEQPAVRLRAGRSAGKFAITGGRPLEGVRISGPRTPRCLSSPRRF